MSARRDHWRELRERPDGLRAVEEEIAAEHRRHRLDPERDLESLEGWLDVIRSEIEHGEDVLPLFDVLLGTYADSPTTSVQARVYEAEVSRGLLLDQLGRVEAADDHFRVLLDQRGTIGEDPAMDGVWFYASFRSYQRELGKLVESEQARAAGEAMLDELVRDFGDSDLPRVVSGIAEAFHNLADLFLARGEEEPALATLLRLLDRIGDDRDGPAEQMRRAAHTRIALLQALRLEPVLLDTDDTAPPEYADVTVKMPWLAEEKRWADFKLRRKQERERTLRGRIRGRLFPERRAFMEPTPEEAQRDYEEILARARENHGRATEMITRYRYYALPFLLHLRNYEVEGAVGFIDAQVMRDQPADLRPTPFVMAWDPSGTSPSEAGLLHGLQESFPVISIANSFGGDLDVNLPAAHLLTPDRRWREIASELIEHAEAITMRLAGLSPGVEDELQLVRDAQRVDDTVVVLVDVEDQERYQQMQEIFRGSYGLEPSTSTVLPPDSPHLDGFTVVAERDLYGDPPSPIPAFERMAARFHEISQLGLLDKLARLDRSDDSPAGSTG